MKNKVLEIIEEELFQDNIDTELKENSIFWKDNFGTENEINNDQIAVNGNVIAWWQKNEVGKELVRIKVQDDIIINWRPPINTMGLNFGGCGFIEFYLEFLILKYRDKHRERIFIINTKNLKIVEINTEGGTKGMILIKNNLYIKELPSGQITKISIHSDKLINVIIDENYLISKNIIF